jgi:probable HAF family extracellular repeat protein
MKTKCFAAVILTSMSGLLGFVCPALSLDSWLYSNGTYTTLNNPAATNTLAQDINNSGQIVGAYNTVPGDSGALQNGFLYSNGTYTTINERGLARFPAAPFV